MSIDCERSYFGEKDTEPVYSQLHSMFKKLVGKKIRFCLKNNNYDRILLFEAILAGFHPCKQLRKIGNLEWTDWIYKIDNDKGIEINVPIQKLIRVDEPDNINANNYFLIFERHFWSLEVLTSGY